MLDARRSTAPPRALRRPRHAIDFKADVSVGWTLGDAWSPYLAVRGFGGPIFWKQNADLDTLAAGFNLSLVNRVSLYFDGACVGMRGLSGGMSVRF